MVREFLVHANDVKESNCKLKRKHAYSYDISEETIFSLASADEVPCCCPRLFVKEYRSLRVLTVRRISILIATHWPEPSLVKPFGHQDQHTLPDSHGTVEPFPMPSYYRIPHPFSHPCPTPQSIFTQLCLFLLTFYKQNTQNYALAAQNFSRLYPLFLTLYVGLVFICFWVLSVPTSPSASGFCPRHCVPSS